MSTLRPIERSSIWYDDGDIVLECEHIAFKVHLHRMTTTSMVFRDMASIPQPTVVDIEATEAFAYADTYPSSVIRMHDAASDMKPFLEAIYNPSYVYYIANSASPPKRF